LYIDSVLLNQIKIDPNVQPFKQAPRPMRIESLKKRLSSRQKAQLSWFHTGRRESRLGGQQCFSEEEERTNTHVRIFEI